MSPVAVTWRAVFAWSPMRCRIAPVVRPFARASSHLPSWIRPMMMADESKYVSPDSPARITISGYIVTKTLYPQAALVPTATSVLMFVPKPCRNERQAAS